MSGSPWFGETALAEIRIGAGGGIYPLDTVKLRPLLTTAPTVTTTLPEAPSTLTVLVSCMAPKFAPLIVTESPPIRNLEKGW